MKLFKKLMPIASVASCVAIVTPLATSCNKGVSISHDYSKGEYKITVAQPTYRDSWTVITDKFFADINHNKKIFCEDYLRGGAWGIILTGLNEGTMKITVNSVNQTEHRISYKLSITTNKLGTEPYKIEYTAKDVIYCCYSGSELGVKAWYIEPYADELEKDSKWSIEYNKNGTITKVNKSNMLTSGNPTIIAEGEIISTYLDNCEEIGE